MATPKKEKNGLYSIRFGIKKFDGSIERYYKTGFNSSREAIRYELDKREEYSNIIDDRKLFYNIIDELIYQKEFIEKLEQSTLASYEQYFDYIKNDISNKPILEITQRDIQDAILKNATKPRKCKWYKQLLTMLYNYSYKAGYTPYDARSSMCPLSKVTFPEYIAKQKDFGYENEIQILLEYTQKNCPSLVAPILLSGGLSLRPSEILAITKDKINPEFILVDQAITRVKRKDKNVKYDLHGTKTKKSTRKIPLTKDYYKAIIQFSSNFDTPFVCCTKTGSQLRLDNFEAQLQRCIKKIKLVHPNFPNLTPYSLRHSFGNIAKRNGIDVYTVATLMGHSNIQTTTNNYYREDETLNREATTKIISSLTTGSKIGSKF